MTILKTSILCFILTCIFSCQSKTNSSEYDTNEKPNGVFIAADSSIFIEFEEFKVFVENAVLINDESEDLEKDNKDSVSLFLELGEDLDGKRLYIESKVLENIRIEQRFQTTSGITLESEQCDLRNWKHYLSEWQELHMPEPNIFVTKVYTDEDSKLFPKVTATELKDAIKQNCVGNFISEAEKAVSVHEYPMWVSISQYYFRVSGYHRESKEKMSKIIKVNLPLGC